jgi:hypothetical protein
MNIKRLTVVVFCTGFFCLSAFSSHGKEIQLTNKDMTCNLLYLANQLGVKVIHTNFSPRDLKFKKFSAEGSSIEEIIEKYQEEYKDILKIHYDKDRKIIICSDKRISYTFEQFLKYKIIRGKENRLYVLFGKKKQAFQIRGDRLPGKGGGEIQNNLVAEWGKAFSPNLTVQELIFDIFDRGEIASCEIPFKMGLPRQQGKKEKRIIDELKRKIQAMEEGSDKESEDGQLERLRGMLERMEQPIRGQDALNMYCHYQSPEDWKEPTYEQSAEFLKIAGSGPMMPRERHRIIEFYIYKFIAFDAVNFLSVLLQHDVFDKAPARVGLWAAIWRGSTIAHEIPRLLEDVDDYEAIQYLLKNMDKIKNKEKQRDIILDWVHIDKNRLDKESRDIFLTLAKEFNVERIYVDTSKWIGDDLPDDYDRWQGFNVSEVELVCEEDKAVGKIQYQTEYHVKFYHYRTPVKIGGIPLRKFEETDYSTPEKSRFSSLSARTYEWKKASCHDDYPPAYYSPLSDWKRWNSGLDHFAEILYKVEITRVALSQQEASSIFLVEKILDKNNKIVTTPMILDKGKWKSVFRGSAHTEILSEYIEEKIATLLAQ